MRTDVTEPEHDAVTGEPGARERKEETTTTTTTAAAAAAADAPQRPALATGFN